MTLPASGAITMAQVNTEMNISPSTTAVTLNNTQVRNLAQKSSGAVTLDDLHGKYQNWITNFLVNSVQFTATSKTQDSSGNIYFVGGVNYSGSPYNVILKFNVSGVFQWGYQWPLSYSTGGDAYGITIDSTNGDIFVNGTCSGYLGSYLWVMKLNSSATQQWLKCYGVTSAGAFPQYLIPISRNGYVDSSGNFYSAFWTQGGSTQQDISGFIKLDSNGNYLTNFGCNIGSTLEFRGSNPNMSVDSSGTFAVIGTVNGATGGTYYPNIAKVNLSGSIVWQKRWPNNASMTGCNGATFDSAGNIYILYTTTVFNQNGSCLIVKLDSNGNQLWCRQITNNVSYSLAAQTPIILPNGNIAVQWNYVYQDPSTFAYTNYVGAFVYDTSGVLQFVRGINITSGDSLTYAGGGVIADAYNNIIVNAPQATSGNWKYMISKIPLTNTAAKIGTNTIGSDVYNFSAFTPGTTYSFTESDGTTTLGTMSSGTLTGYTMPTVFNPTLTATPASVSVSSQNLGGMA